MRGRAAGSVGWRPRHWIQTGGRRQPRQTLRDFSATSGIFTILTNGGKNAIVDSGVAALFPIPLGGTHRYYPPAKFAASESPWRLFRSHALPARSLYRLKIV